MLHFSHCFLLFSYFTCILLFSVLLFLLDVGKMFYLNFIKPQAFESYCTCINSIYNHICVSHDTFFVSLCITFFNIFTAEILIYMYYTIVFCIIIMFRNLDKHSVLIALCQIDWPTWNYDHVNLRTYLLANSRALTSYIMDLYFPYANNSVAQNSLSVK